jgi:GNAT superfamily N-acetyltransferase
MEIRALRATDDRSTFRCGDEALDRFFRQYAGQNQFRHYLGVTYVAVETDRIAGFVTVAPRHIDVEDLPERARQRLPRYPVPVLGLARLAVDKSFRSRGVGSMLLRFVLSLSGKLADDGACAGVVVDAKPGGSGARDFYARLGFVTFDTLEGESEARPRPTAMWLPIQAIKKAMNEE